MEKLKKEEIYINLQGKSEEELTELYNFLKSVGEKLFRKNLKWFLKYANLKEDHARLSYRSNCDNWGNQNTHNKQEVTIQQLKETLQPMEGFRPIAMKCTQEQFEAIKPKLKGCRTQEIDKFTEYEYLINNYCNVKNSITNVEIEDAEKRTVHEEWNEEIFLKACGIEVETLEQQLEKAKAEVKRIEKEIEYSNKPNIGDWVVNIKGHIYKYDGNDLVYKYEKITEQELINKLNNLIK